MTLLVLGLVGLISSEGAAQAPACICILGSDVAFDDIMQTPEPLLVYPDLDCTCDNFSVVRFTVDLYFHQHLVPLDYPWDGTQTNFTYTAELLEAVWDPTSGTFSPGDPLCTTTWSYISPIWCTDCVMVDNLLRFDQVIDFDSCACADGQYPYYLSVTTSGMGPVNAQPFVMTYDGVAAVTAEAECCEPSVFDMNDTWGNVKALYR